MSEAGNQNETIKTADAADSDLTLDLNFVPQWARRPPDAARFARFDDADQESRRGGSSHRGGDRGRDSRGDRTARPGDDRRRSRDRRPEPGGSPAAPDRNPPVPERAGAPARPLAGRPVGDRDARPERQGDRPSRDMRPPIEPLPLNVRFLPERKPLSDLIRRVSSTNRAYPLLDLAALLMAKEGCCYVKIEVFPEAKDVRLYQCTHCNTLAMSRDAIEAHVMNDHIETLFDVQEETVDPPSGVFVCVAKCGFSGVLLGPPNHHSYAEAVKRLHAERFAAMDFEVYRRRIQTSHAPEDVERWKVESSTRVVYRLKSATDSVTPPQGEAMSRADALRYMRTTILPDSIQSTRRAVLSEKEAHGVRDPGIRHTIRTEWQQESRFPIHLAFALRAAFRHRGLHMFKTGRDQTRGMNFVTAVKPTPLDPETAIPAIRDALLFMQTHPGCSRKDMVEALRPNADPASDEVKALLQPIHWLVEKGHIIEFFNGTLSVPRTSRR